MGLFDFVKEAGEKVFGRDRDDEDAKRTEVEAKAEAGRELLDERRKAAAIVKLVEGLGLEVRDLSVKVDDATATLKGTVSSHELREKVVLAVGNTHGIGRVDDRLEVAAGTGGAPAAAADSTFYTVQRGDTLSGIAKRHYGDAGAYMRIFEANKPMLKDPDKIYPGQVLRVPPKG